ncbi:hypothetical protein BY996DRAFT_6889341 [Phakopsora pachyrhizi]|nr:hypothetical protein BY996DRAFT_6889341 [Phakopsora pachyrhizi]
MTKSSYPPVVILNLSTSSQNSGAQAVVHRQYFRKTARGKVQRISRQQYLRNDIPCGSSICSSCSNAYSAVQDNFCSLVDENNGKVKNTSKRQRLMLLSSTGRENHQTYKSHYLVLDTNVILRQIDLLEASAFGTDLIIPQTVLDEVRHRSLPVFNRLKALINESDSTGRYSRGWIFWNESNFETYLERSATETINDRNDRAIRQVCKWYRTHLSEHKINVVLLTDDRANLEKALKDSIKVSSTIDYVRGMDQKASSILIDLVAASSKELETGDEDDPRNERKRSTFYDEYLSPGELNIGIKGGQLYEGVFRLNPYNYLEGSISHSEFERPILLIGSEAINRSIDGDLVAVELLSPDEWKSTADEMVVEQDATGPTDDPDPELTDTPLLKVDQQQDTANEVTSKLTHKQPTGRVVGVIRRNWRPYVCHIDRSSVPSSALQSNLSSHPVFAVPLSRSVPKIRIRTRQAASLINQKFIVSIDRWDTNSRYPEGHFVRALGLVESKEAEQESLLLEHDVPYRPFGKSILDCLPEAGEKWVVPPKTDGSSTWKNREDFRDLMICSIDPPGCQDIDDALHAKRLENGNVEAGVHIADVSHFVLPGTPMDAEAASRGTTVYLVDKRIDMLPSLLGTNLCSLKPQVERLAFSVVWELVEETGEIVNVRFTKSVIKSKAAFTYEAAQLRKDEKSRSDEITQSIRLLNKLAIMLKKKRMEAGALNLASPEVKIHMDSTESSDPIDVEQKESMETNSLVEEFMLLANISVAKRIYDSFPQMAVLRRHRPPPQTNFEVLQDVLKKRRGLELDVSSSGALAASLDKCIDPNVPAFNTLVRIMATRCMLPAEYFGSGSVSKDSFGHYGLASPIYTHFTSPIRRYADVLVHRQLQASINDSNLQKSMNSKQFVEKLMENINKRHKSAQRAGRASVEFYVALAIKSKQKESVNKAVEEVFAEAFVIRTFRNGLAVFVSQYGIEGLIKFKKEQEYNGELYEIKLKAKENKDQMRINKTNNNYVDCGGEKVERFVKLGIFDKVLVGISTEKDKSTRRGKVKMRLIEPEVLIDA